MAAKRRAARSPLRSRGRSSRPPWACDQAKEQPEERPGDQEAREIDRPVVLGGRYRVERELGKGGMAKVFQGTDTVLGRSVAIKILAPQFAEDENFVMRFRREAQAAARISNQTIVSVFDTGSDDDVHFIVMEYVEGKTLAEFLTGGGRILPDRAIDIAEHVCRALEAAHAQGVIHRDIKPGNIMLNARGEVKVTDFGIARMTTTAETVAQTAAVLGTASYLSPEQAQGQPVDGRSDIYSLGCVVYEMVTGRPPFLGDSPVTVASKQVLEQPTPPSKLNPDVPPDLDAVILRALAKNPANRYQSAEELRADLDRVRRGSPVEATPILAPSGATQVMERPVPAARTQVLEPAWEPEPERGRWWVPVIVTVLILGILGGVLWFLAQSLLSGGDEPEPTGPAPVIVPSVIGERLGRARTILEEAQLVVADEIVEVVIEDLTTQTPNTVLDQDPAPEAEALAGDEVTLTVLVAPDAVPIPVVAGSSPDAALATLQGEGFVPVFEDQASADVDVGFVIGTDPPEGTPAPFGSEVTVFVSTGPGTVTVPSVTCLSFNAAQNRIVKAGLEPFISSETVPINSACPLGNKVAAQDPSPGFEVEPGSTVTLYAGEVSEPTGPTGPTGPT